MNVRFYAGTKQQYLAIPAHNPVALYFCSDTKELFWGDILLSDGMRVVKTRDELPSLDAAADGVVYYVADSRNGYTLAPDGKSWLQTIYAPATDAYKVPESEVYNTVTTVGAVRDLMAELVADIEETVRQGGVKSINFAGVELTEVDGNHIIDRACARRALGLLIPEGMEDSEIAFVTSEQVDQKIAESGLATKEEVNALGAALNAFENHLGFVSTRLDADKTIAETINDTFAKKTEMQEAIERVEEAINNINHFKTEIVTDISKVTDVGILYLIKDTAAVGVDQYNEYIVVDGQPILIGDTTTDLSNYYNREEVDALLNKLKLAIKELKSQYAAASEIQAVLEERVTTLENNTVTKAELDAYKDTVELAVAGARDAAITWAATELLDIKDSINEVHRDVDTVHRDVDKVHDEVDAVHREIDALKDHIESTYVTINELEEKNYITEAEAEVLVDTKVQEVVKKELEAVDSIAYGDFDI